MSIDVDAKVTVGVLLIVAGRLQSDGTNTEYDRALCELIADCQGGDSTPEQVAKHLGISQDTPVESLKAEVKSLKAKIERIKLDYTHSLTRLGSFINTLFGEGTV